MAYQNLQFENLAGKVTGRYNDGNLKLDITNDALAKKRIISIGTAEKGALNEIYNVDQVETTMNQFGANSELAESISQIAAVSPEFNLGVVRVGSKPFHWRLKRNIADLYEKDTLISIVPSFVQEKDVENEVFSTLENLRLVLLPYLHGNIIRQRVILLGVNEGSRTEFNVVYDSERILIENGELGFDVKIDVPLGEFLYTKGSTGSIPITLVSGNYTDDQIEELSSLSTFHFDGSLDLSENEDNTFDQIEVVSTLAAKTVAVITNTDYKLVTYAGETKKVLNHCERYAHVEKAYSVLEFDSFDFLQCTGCFADVKPVSLTDTTEIAKAIDWAADSLGYMWKYEFNGKPYVYMFSKADPFLSADVNASYSSDDITYTFSAENKKLGHLLNLVELHLHPKAAGTNTEIETFSNEKGMIECHVEFDADAGSPPDAIGFTEEQYNALLNDNGGAFSDNNENAGAGNGFDDRTGLNLADHNAYIAAGYQSRITLNTPFCSLDFKASKYAGNETVEAIRLRPSLIDADDSVSASLRGGQATNNDPFVISHWDLFQEEIPEAVVARLLDFPESGDTTATLVAKAIEVREISFAHQAAQMAWQASTNYNQTIALIPTTKPAATRNGLDSWAGNPADYEIQNNGVIKVTANGTGVLGTKLLAGEVGYRSDAAFGGIILTNGNDLPNEKPYGISDIDEAKDANGLPIDLGKHLLIIGSWGYINNPAANVAANSRSTFGSKFVNAAANIAQMLVDLPAGNEPIGPSNGFVPGIRVSNLTPKAILNNLAALRIVMIDQNNVISSINTSALRTSDYRKLSSIMSSNEIIKRIRESSSPVLGTALNDATIQSLQTQMDGMSRALVSENYAQSCTIRLIASREDRINGVLNARVSFVPPFSLETINVDITLEAPSV